MQFYLRVILRKGEKHAYPDDWKKIIIPDIASKEQDEVVNFVDKIIKIKKQLKDKNDKIKIRELDYLENSLDNYIFELYQLSSEEIEILNEKFKLSDD